MDEAFFDSAPVADPYDGIELGVECAWPLSPEGAPLWAAQYTVSTGTPNR